MLKGAFAVRRNAEDFVRPGDTVSGSLRLSGFSLKQKEVINGNGQVACVQSEDW
jgi:hypothetical protein